MSLKSLTESVVRLTKDTWGDTVSYIPNGDPARSIKGVFSNAWVDVEGVVSLKPTLRIQLSDLVNLPGDGDRTVVNGAEYRVMESRLDEFGGSTLILHKA